MKDPSIISALRYDENRNERRVAHFDVPPCHSRDILVKPDTYIAIHRNKVRRPRQNERGAEINFR